MTTEGYVTFVMSKIITKCFFKTTQFPYVTFVMSKLITKGDATFVMSKIITNCFFKTTHFSRSITNIDINNKMR